MSNELSEFAKLIAEGKRAKQLEEENKKKTFFEKYSIEKTEINPFDFIGELIKLKKESEQPQQEVVVEEILPLPPPKSATELLSELASLIAEGKKANGVVFEEQKENIESFVAEVVQDIAELKEEEVKQEEIKEEPVEKDLIAQAVDSITKVAENTNLFDTPEPDKVSPNFKAIQAKLKSLEQWVAKISTAGSGSGSYWLNDLGDTDKTSLQNATDGQVLTFSTGVGKWIAADSSGGGSGADQFARDTANGATNLAQSAYDFANTITISGNVDAYARSQSANAIANTVYTQGVDVWQNTQINNTNTLAQASFNYANTISLSGLSGSLQNVTQIGNTTTLGITTSAVQLNLSSAITVSQGQMAWNSADLTVDVGMAGGVTLQLGQEQYIKVKASENILNGETVMFAGADGEHILAARCNTAISGFKPEWFIGIATQDLAHNTFGYVTVFGKVHDLNTLAYQIGDILWVDANNVGAMTKTAPTLPLQQITVAAVTKRAGGDGHIMVRPTWESQLVLNNYVNTQLAFNQANTTSSNTIYTQGVDTTQNTRLTVIEGTNVTQNTAIASTDGKMQSAYNQANTGTNLAQTVSDTANNILAEIIYLHNVDYTQNTDIENTIEFVQSIHDELNVSTILAQASYNQANTGTVLAQAAFDAANTGGGVTLDQFARNTANTGLVLAQGGFNQANVTIGIDASQNSRMIIIEGVDLGQNTSIASTDGKMASAYNQANSATNLAQSAYDKANTFVDTYTDQYARDTANLALSIDNTQNVRLDYSNTAITIIQGTNVTQNTAISSTDGKMQSAYNQANVTIGVDTTQNTRLTVIEGTNTTQNTAIAATDGKMQSAYDTANTKVSKSGDTMTGDLKFGSGGGILGNYATNEITFTSNVINDFSGFYASDSSVAQVYANTFVQLIANTGGGGVFPTWNFNADGSLTIPPNGLIIASTGTYGQQHEMRLGDGLMIGQDGGLANYKNVTWSLMGQNSDSGTQIRLPGQADSDNGLSLLIQHLYANSSIDIESVAGTWTFDANGSLTLPGGTVVDDINYSGAIIQAPTGKTAEITSHDFNSGFQVSDTNAIIYTDAGNWTFDADGSLTLPASSGQIGRSGYTNGIDLYNNSGGAGYVRMNYADESVMWADPGGAHIQTNGSNTWNFGVDGSLSFPDGSKQYVAYDSTYAQGAFAKANSASANTIIIQGVDVGQNTAIAATDGKMQSAYNQANTGTVLAQASYDNSNTKFNSSGGTISGNVSITKDLSITGNLTVLGTATTLNTSSFSVTDSLALLAVNNYTTDLLDIGIVGHYNNTQNAHTGIFRDASEKEWMFFDNYTPEITSNNNVIISDPSFRYANVRADTFKGNLIATTATVNGNTVLTAGDLVTVTYLANYITMNPALVTVPVVGTSTTYGSYNFGDVNSIRTYGDYDVIANTGFYSVNDASGAPGHVEYIGFTGVTDFNRIVLNINYTASSGHTQDIDVYNYQTNSWDTFGTYSGSGNWQQFSLQTIDAIPYISSGNVTIRNYHVNSGNTQHRTWIDYVAVEKSITGGQGPRGATGATGPAGPVDTSSFNKANSANVLAQSAFDQANTGTILAQASYNQANVTVGVDTTQNSRMDIIEGTDVSQNTRLDYSNTVIAIIQGVDVGQNSRMTIIEGTDVSQNTRIDFSNTRMGLIDGTDISQNVRIDFSNTRMGLIDGTDISQNTRIDYSNAAITIIQGTDVGQNSRMTIIEGTDVSQNVNIVLLQNAMTSANANIVILFGIGASQNANTILLQAGLNTANANGVATDGKMQSAYNQANVTAGGLITANANSFYIQSGLNSANANVVILFDTSASQNVRLDFSNTAIAIIQGVDLGQNTSISSTDGKMQSAYNQANTGTVLAQAAFDKANTGGGGGISSSGYLANSIIIADGSGYLSNTSNLQFITSNNSLQVFGSAYVSTNMVVDGVINSGIIGTSNRIALNAIINSNTNAQTFGATQIVVGGSVFVPVTSAYKITIF